MQMKCLGLNAVTAATLALGVCYAGAAAAASPWQFSLVPDRNSASSVVPVSATPYDPTSLPQETFFGRDRYSSRAVAFEIILNAIDARQPDSLVYRRNLNDGYRVTTRWRLRASGRRVTLRYEIRF
ncbi:MAG: hypothetical protein AB8C46_26030 [Burkholderiaceae bacterium]